jgi:tyrosinase
MARSGRMLPAAFISLFLMFCHSPYVGAQTVIRRDITTLSTSELAAYRDAFRQLQRSGGDYAGLAGHHGCPDYYCHDDSTIFLPWHRAYILRFEQALQRIDPSLALHYWDWTSDDAVQNGIPDEFTDEDYQSGGNTFDNPLRRFGYQCGNRDQFTSRDPQDPFLLESVRARVDVAYGLNSYSAFNGSGGIQGPHGSLHVWVREEMRDTEWAAYDPVFWAHHSNVDRQWARWQGSSNGADPENDIMQKSLEPFDMTVAEVIDYRELGYEYDNLGGPGFRPFMLVSDKSIRIKNFDLRQDTGDLALFVDDMPEHPTESYEVYIFVDQPDATRKDATKDNPNFVGFFGIFGGRHGKQQRSTDGHEEHEAKEHADSKKGEPVPVVTLSPAIRRFARTKGNAEKLDVSLNIVVVDSEGKQVSLSKLPFKTVSVRPERAGRKADH